MEEWGPLLLRRHEPVEPLVMCLPSASDEIVLPIDHMPMLRHPGARHHLRLRLGSGVPACLRATVAPSPPVIIGLDQPEDQAENKDVSNHGFASTRLAKAQKTIRNFVIFWCHGRGVLRNSFTPHL